MFPNMQSFIRPEGSLLKAPLEPEFMHAEVPTKPTFNRRLII